MIRREVVDLRESEDVLKARQQARALALSVGFGLVDQTKIVTAVSELARNTVTHGGGGTATLEVVEYGAHRGLRIVFRDQGPGIADVEQALRDGYTTAGGLGLGLGGSRRLMNDFEISSFPGKGTTVTVVRWK
jgi:serine/threonine-protein kinase RsbT